MGQLGGLSPLLAAPESGSLTPKQTEQSDYYMTTYRVLVLEQRLVVTRDGREEEHSRDILEAVDPLFPL